MAMTEHAEGVAVEYEDRVVPHSKASRYKEEDAMRPPTQGPQLEARLPPSVRHPEGLPRCQFWRRREDPPQQCKRAARAGFRTCGFHGAGFEARERRGERKNPARVRIVNGNRAKLRTLDAIGLLFPELEVFYGLALVRDRLNEMKKRLRKDRGRPTQYLSTA